MPSLASTSAPAIDASPDTGVAGNERLTGWVGGLLILPLALEGATILFIGQLRWLHMFVGMFLFGLVGLKLASTGFRFAGYYSHRPAYVRKGPPATPLRMLAVPVVLSTIGVFGTGLLLALDGPGSREPLLLTHKVFFIVWIAFTAVHVLAHLAGAYRAVHDDLTELPTGTPTAGLFTRRLLLIGVALLSGLVIALIVSPDFSAWQHAYAFAGPDH